MWTWFISLYGIFATIAIVVVQKNRRGDESLISQIDQSELPPLDRLNSTIELAKLRQASLPWFERSISTAGVVAFFSLLIGTGFQAVKSDSDAIRAAQIEREVKELQSQKLDFERAVRELAQSVVAQYQRTSYIDDSGIRVLKERLHYLERDDTESRDRLIEAFGLAMVAGEYREAARLLSSHTDLLDRTKSTDLIILAEFYYLTGDSDSAKAMLKNLEGMLGGAPLGVRIRAVILNATLDPSAQEGLVKQYAALLRLDLDDAGNRLERGRSQMRAASAEFRVR
jgi:hypothetical protein